MPAFGSCAEHDGFRGMRSEGKGGRALSRELGKRIDEMLSVTDFEINLHAYPQTSPSASSAGGRIRSSSTPMTALARSTARHSSGGIFRISSGVSAWAIQ